MAAAVPGAPFSRPLAPARYIRRAVRGTRAIFREVACKGTLPCFAQGTFDVAELGAKGKGVRARLEEFASVEAEGLVEGREEEVFLWD